MATKIKGSNLTSSTFIIPGDLQVDGTTTTINSTTLTVDDKNLVLASGAGNAAAADGAGLTIDGASATFTYAATGDKFGLNKTLEVTGDLFAISTDAGSTEAPSLTLFRSSASPADNDNIGVLSFSGKNDAAQSLIYGKIKSAILDASDGSEDGSITFQARRAGSLASFMNLSGASGRVNIQRDLFIFSGADIIFEGATSDDYETTLTVTDPTADRTINLPDATGTIMLNVSEDTTPQLGGNLDLNSNNITGTGNINTTGTATFTTTDNNPQLIVKSTDADATHGPLIHLLRDSVSPAADDVLGQVKFIGKNSAAEEITYGKVDIVLRDPTDGTEDSEMRFLLKRAGDSPNALKLGSVSTVFNDSGYDVDFRVESDNIENAFFIQGSDGNIGIGTGSPVHKLHIVGDGTNDARLVIDNPGTGSSDDSILRLTTGGTTGRNFIQFGDSGDSNAGQIKYDHADNSMRFTTGAGERLVLDNTLIATTSTTVRMGQGTGGISLTTNDGYGNANICFNHEGGVPEQGSNDSSGRITCDTDNASSRMGFELKSTVSAGSGVTLTPVLQLYGTAGTGGYGTMVSEGGTAGRVDLQQGSCKAWIRWEMIGTFSTADSYNVSSTSDQGQGLTAITINNNMNNSNWVAVLGGTASQTSGGTLSLDSSGFLGQGTTPYRTASVVQTRTVSGSGGAADADDNNLAVFGDQA